MFLRTLLIAALCSAVACCAQVASRPATTLPEPTKALVFPEALGTPGFWSYWQADRFVQFATIPSGPRSTSVTLYHNEGQFDRSLPIWTPEAREMILRDAVVTRGNILVVAGSLTTNDDKLKRFIAEPNEDGTFRRVIWTDRFQAMAVCPMEDGSIWVYGSKPWDPGDHTFSVLRHYSFEKGLLGEALPKSNFPRHLMATMPHQSYFLTTDTDHLLGLDMDADGAFKLDLKTNHLSFWRISSLDYNLQGAAVLSSSGEAYATLLSPRDGSKGGSVYKLITKDDGTASWIPIEGTAFGTNMKDFRGWLIGNDGDELVFRKATDQGTEVQWSRPGPTTLSMK